MALYGSTIPTDHGEFVVTVVCPNAYSHQRLMQAINSIVPDAGEPEAAHHATEAPMPPHLAERLDGKDDDEGTPYDVSGDPDYRAGGSE